MSQSFSSVLVAWQKKHGRQTLPWQNTGDAYKTWLSEIMLQQTQVATVLSYYKRFIEQFPSVQELAAAPSERIMTLWQGLGYYSRARNLHECAKQVVLRFNGEFPQTVEELESLPGIGRSTAGAVMSLGHGLSAPILDGNVKRVFCRYLGVEGYPEQSAIKRHLWEVAASLMPSSHQLAGPYNQALMDLGATVCVPRNPKCDVCPVRSNCVALKHGKTHLLPTPKLKKERVSLYFVALLLQDESERYLVCPQPEKGLWRGLWMPPVFELSGSDLNVGETSAWFDNFEIPFSEVDLSGQDWLVHDLTHRKMHFKCIRMQTKRLTKLPEGFLYAGANEKPFPRVFQKLIDHEVP